MIFSMDGLYFKYFVESFLKYFKSLSLMRVIFVLLQGCLVITKLLKLCYAYWNYYFFNIYKPLVFSLAIFQRRADWKENWFFIKYLGSGNSILLIYGCFFITGEIYVCQTL